MLGWGVRWLPDCFVSLNILEFFIRLRNWRVPNCLKIMSVKIVIDCVFFFSDCDDGKPADGDDDIIFEDFARLRLKGADGDA